MIRLRALALPALLAGVWGGAAFGGVVLNELMYHPASLLEFDEFVELHNPDGEVVDLSGWCVEGIEFCFPPGATIPAGGFLVLGRDPNAFALAYGGAPDYLYAGTLDNGGERLVLRNGLGEVVDVVEYDDVPPWPVTPDGLGRSLERIAASLPGDTPRNWAGSNPASTVRALNSVAGAALPPWLSDVTFLAEPDPGEAIPVSVRAQDATDVQLVYRIDFAEPATVAMQDTGGGVFAAEIPGQGANALVRFQIQAVGPTGSMRYPRVDDSVSFDGTVVRDPDLVTALPVVHWYIDPNDYAAALAHYYTDELEPGVIFYGGKLYDNAQFRVRGETSRWWDKKHWKVHFAQGHDFTDPERIPVAIDQCDLLSPRSDKAYIREILAQNTLRDAGAPYSPAFHVRVHKNGEFFGLYTMRMGADDDFLAYNGLDGEGAWYKAYGTAAYLSLPQLPSYYEKKTRQYEGYEDLHALLYAIQYLTGQARHDYLFNNIDLAAMANYQASMVLMHNNDQVAKNYLLYRDTRGTQRWSMHAWDLDLTFGRNYGAGGGVLSDGIWADNDDVGRPGVSPSHPLFGDSTHQKYDYLWNRITNALHNDPEYRAMYYRRLRTLMDQMLAPGYYEAQIAALAPACDPEVVLDIALWDQYGIPQTHAEALGLILDDYLPRRRHHLFVTHRVAGEIPPPQSAAPPIVISEIMYNSAAGPDRGFVELYNPSMDEAVDLSDWQLTGVGLRFPPGCVLLPRHYAVAVRNDPAFRSAYSGARQVLGVYSTPPNAAGGLIELRMPDGTLIDSVRYDDQAPWPTTPDGGGPSLEVIDLARDNARVSNWAASVVVGGTPGLPNSVAASLAELPGVWLNELLPNNVSVNVDEMGEHDPWIELYNASASPVNLGGHYLSDNPALPAKWVIPAGTTIEPQHWLLVWADNEPGEGPRHANFRLDTNAGVVTLATPDLTLLDAISYENLAANVALGRFHDGEAEILRLDTATPGAANLYAAATPMILNEYNAVDDDKTLKNNGSDTYWGRVFGNGGDWFELVVTRDHVDARGWQFVVSNDTGGPGHTVEILTLTDAAVWSDLRIGTIVTVSENLADDVSFDPLAGDWWINVRAADDASGVYITAESFKVSNNNWQLTIRDNLGAVLYGPAGEGIAPASGIGGDEVFRLAADPSSAIPATSAFYDDSIHSTFGAPNIYDNGVSTQDFSALRGAAAPCRDDADCDDGNPCTVDTCLGFAGCGHEPRPDGASCGDDVFCNGAETCQAGACVSGGAPCQDAAHCDELGGTCLPCVANEECSDDNPCTTDVCVDGQCEFTPVSDGTACDDGAYCTIADTCQAGVCVGAGDPCAEACLRCDETSRACQRCALDLFTADGGQIGGGDFVIFASYYGACYAQGDPALVADFDLDGCVGGSDFVMLAFCYAGPCSACANCFPASEE